MLLKSLQCHYAIEEDSEGDNDSEEFYYVGQVSSAESLHFMCITFLSVYYVWSYPLTTHNSALPSQNYFTLKNKLLYYFFFPPPNIFIEHFPTLAECTTKMGPFILGHLKGKKGNQGK